jgi:hypothetical protein
MDAEHLELPAAVGVPPPARVAVRVVEVRLDRAAVAGPDVYHPRADLEHLDPQLMPRNAGVAEERHLAQVAADVGAADADPVDAHQRLARPGLPGRVRFDALEVLGRFQQQGFH